MAKIKRVFLTLFTGDQCDRSRLLAGEAKSAKALGWPDADTYAENLYQWLYHGRTRYTMNIALQCENPEELKLLDTYTQIAIARVTGENGYFKDSALGIKTLFENLDDCFKLPDISYAKPRGYSGAICVGAGPSLEKHIDELFRVSKIRQDIAIIAADTALLRLKSEGIRVDFVVSTERYPYAKNYLEGDHPNTTLVTNLYCHPEIPATWKSKRCFVVTVRTNFMWIPWNEGRKIIRSAVSVLPHCLTVARILGLTDVFLVGVDLSFDETTGDSHADLKDQTVADEFKNDVFIPATAPGNDSNEVKTMHAWLNFGFQITRMKREHKLRIVNGSKRGLKINECPYGTMNEWLSSIPARQRQKIFIPEINRYGAEEKNQTVNECINMVDRLDQLNFNGSVEEFYKNHAAYYLLADMCQKSLFLYENFKFRFPEKHDAVTAGFMQTAYEAKMLVLPYLLNYIQKHKEGKDAHAKRKIWLPKPIEITQNKKSI